MRNRQEIERQIEGLENQKKGLPEYSQLGTANWAEADAQIAVLKGASSDDYEPEEWDDPEGEESDVYRAAVQAEEWMDGDSDEDLFSPEYEPKTQKPMSAITVLATNDNITLVYNKETILINRIKNEKIYNELLEKIHANDVEWIKNHFEKIKTDIEMKSNDHFTIVNEKVVLKGTQIPVPEAIVKKLMELEKEKEPILPLLRFWRKLSENPSEESRKDLYGFMIANNIPITEEGDIVTEKGVLQKPGGFPGDLIDKHSRSIDNTVGNMVSMPREKVNPNRDETCSFGLHVGAPDYVRNHWSSDIIIECIVNPKDVVSVPTDYKNTKMRVCAYRVAGYSRKNSRSADKVVKLSDFFSTPLPEQEEVLASQAQSKGSVGIKPDDTIVQKSTDKLEESSLDFANMSAKAIVDYVKEITGEAITYSLKSKKSIVKKAEELLEVHKIKNS